MCTVVPMVSGKLAVIVTVLCYIMTLNILDQSVHKTGNMMVGAVSRIKPLPCMPQTAVSSPAWATLPALQLPYLPTSIIQLNFRS